MPILLGLVAPLLYAKTAVPHLSGRVVDKAGLLRAEEMTQLDGVLRQFETATRGQFVVLTIPQLEKESIEEFSIRVADEWKIGSAEKDDGLILVISLADRESRLEVGQGFEGSVTDARAGDALRTLASSFQQQRYLEGIVAVVDECAVHITGTGLNAVAAVNAAHNTKQISLPTAIWMLLMFVMFILIVASFLRGPVVIGSNRYGRAPGRGFGGGGFRGGGGFSGGGGRFSGGGASGRW